MTSSGQIRAAHEICGLSADEILHNTWSAEHYVENGQKFLRHLKKL